MTAGTMIVLAWLSLFGLPEVDQTASNYPFIALWVGAPCLAGAALRIRITQAERFADRAARAEMQREEHAILAVQAERGRIARELHDTVAHAVSVMVLHAGAVRSRLPDVLESERAALEQVGDTGRQAIVELRHLLGILRGDTGLPGTEPQPTLAQLDRLIDDARRNGLAVDLRIDGNRRPLEPAVEVSAYRIVQEALTNVRKHAQAQTVSLRLDFDDERLRLRIHDDGVGANDNGATRNGTGFGLVGIRERVEVYGGTLELSSPSGGGFAIDAALPVRQS
jgi:signal transduction histidine kinase